jgi:hypothetical protein
MPITNKFYYPGYDTDIMKDLSPDRWEHYLPLAVIGAAKTQAAFWAHWFNLQDICLGQNYAGEKPPYKPKTWIQFPPIEGPWPGIPITDMKPPTPEPPPQPKPDTKGKFFRMKLKFEFSESKRPIGLRAIFTET